MKKLFISSLFLASGIAFFACNTKKKEEPTYKTFGEVKILEKEGNDIISADAKLEILDSGFVWVEGPLWIEADSTFLFSDVAQNKIYKWKEGQKSVTYLEPSGLTNTNYKGEEPGSNGLLLNNNNQLVIAQHGNRQIAIMDAPLDNPQPKFITLVDSYQGKKVNSPNDLIQDKEGNYYFTDPNFGLSKDAKQELPFAGVFKLTKDNQLILLTDSLSGPNGLALTNDGEHLLVANTSLENAKLYEFKLDNVNHKVSSMRAVYDFTPDVNSNEHVLDGFTIDKNGNIYLTGPKGLWILNKDYKPVVHIVSPQVISNCVLSGDEKTLYMTSDDKILRIKLK